MRSSVARAAGHVVCGCGECACSRGRVFSLSRLGVSANGARLLRRSLSLRGAPCLAKGGMAREAWLWRGRAGRVASGGT